MILSDKSIHQYLKEGKLKIQPIDDYQIQPASVDLILDKNFLQVSEEGQLLNLTAPTQYEKIEKEKMILAAHSFVLATTRERVEVPDFLAAFVEGRSSVGRMGLFIQNAGWVDPGFCGQITLELYNANNLPIEIEAGRRICQIVFAKMDQPVESAYCGKYQNQKGAMSSRVFDDVENQRTDI